jgi:hypothetical protein
MNLYKEKYLKYKNKYLNLKNQKQLIGGAVTINLDEYKELFRELVGRFDYEVGLNLHYDESSHKTTFEITKGAKTVTIPYNSVVLIHTHPYYENNLDEFLPPSDGDYVESCFGYFSGAQVHIILEREGMWLYTPTNELIKLIEEIEPRAREIYNYRSQLVEGKEIYRYTPDELNELLDIIKGNSFNNHNYLNFNSNNEKKILENYFINQIYIVGKLNELLDGSDELVPILIQKATSISNGMNEKQVKEAILNVQIELAKDKLNPEMEDMFRRMGLMRLGNQSLQQLKELFIDNYIRSRIQMFSSGNADEVTELLLPLAKEELKKYSLDDLKEMMPHLHKITLEEYIHEMRNILGEENNGFDVRFIRWSEPFNINIDLNDDTKKIFKELKDRNYLLTEKERDFIMSAIPRTQTNYILKR